jgi:hypothetical protein
MDALPNLIKKSKKVRFSILGSVSKCQKLKKSKIGFGWISSQAFHTIKNRKEVAFLELKNLSQKVSKSCFGVKNQLRQHCYLELKLLSAIFSVQSYIEIV